jgi:hypothetical protein
MKMKLSAFFFVLTWIGLVLPGSVSAQAYSGECGSCVQRKQRMCADECELVAPEKARHCQRQCISQYCSHRCAQDAPELDAYLKENCDDCLEQQFGLCEVHCAVGTPRQKAVCRIQCSAARCTAECPVKPPKVLEKDGEK